MQFTKYNVFLFVNKAFKIRQALIIDFYVKWFWILPFDEYAFVGTIPGLINIYFVMREFRASEVESFVSHKMMNILYIVSIHISASSLTK